MNYEEALKALKNGKLAARKGWNGKGMYIFMMPGMTAKLTQLDKLPEAVVKRFENEGRDEVDFVPYICMKAADGKLVRGWLASQTDMMSDDWEILEDANTTPPSDN